jgi:hypothetical protein
MLKSDEDDFIQYCIKNYKQPFFDKDEFSSDLNKTVTIKKMISRYLTRCVINERLLVNNVITLINVFGVEATNVILFFKLDKDFYPVIKAILIYLNAYKENEYTMHYKVDNHIKNLLEAM